MNFLTRIRNRWGMLVISCAWIGRSGRSVGLRDKADHHSTYSGEGGDLKLPAM